MIKNDNSLIGKLFFKLLPVQILIFSMGSVNSIVDGVMAARFIDADTVGVIGLYYSMVQILSAISNVLIGGSSVLSGKSIGRGDTEKTSCIFSLNLTVTTITGVVITVFCFLFPGALADILGSNDSLKHSLILYILGYAVGILPYLLSQQLALFLQLEGQSILSYAGIIVMILSNVGLDILLVSHYGMGVMGLALATSISNLIYLMVLIPYFISKRASLRYTCSAKMWEDLIPLIKIGFPGALLVFCIAVRYLVINRLLLSTAGTDGISAMGAFNMVAGLYIAFCLGNGSVVRMLVSVFIGEEDRESIKKVIKIVFTKSMVLIIAISAVLFFLAPSFSAIFFPDTASNVYHLTYQIFAVYTFCLPFILICQIFTNYLQSMGHNSFVNFQSVFDGFFSVTVPALILAPVMGVMGVWISNLIGVIIVIMVVPVYCIIWWKRLPSSIDEWMFFKPDFGIPEEDSLSFTFHNEEEISDAAEVIQEFALNHYISKKISCYSALCLEEMAGNVIEHGFNDGRSDHSLIARVIISPEKVLLRIKDDCRPFNPKDFAVMASPEKPYDNIGIKMVFGISDDVNYQNMLGLNVLSVTLNQENLLSVKGTDFLLEKKLKKDAPELHRNYRDVVLSCQNMLTRYQIIFPEFTDHSSLHSMTVIDFCNRLIGEEGIKKLNCDEIYILLCACYLHDIGMGINEKEYESFKDPSVEKEYFEMNPDKMKSDFIRAHHHEFSGVFVDKNAGFFEFPSKEHTFAIKQVVRGHRKTNLYDEREFPSDYRLPNGNRVCIPYLASIIRLADEIDFIHTRNPFLLYDIDSYTIEKEKYYAEMTAAVKALTITENAFVFRIETNDRKLREGFYEIINKMQKILDYCVNVVNSRTDFRITQTKMTVEK